MPRAKSRVSAPPVNGFTYIFVGGHLWREIGIERQGESDDYRLLEINLDKDWGLNTRESHIALQDDTILIPQKVNEQYISDVQIAHSMVQWNWRQLEAFGGFHAKDSRIKGREQAPPSEHAETLRQDRLQRLTQLLPWHAPQIADTYKATPDARDQHHHLPQVPLLNPISIALGIIAEYTQALDAFGNIHRDLPKRHAHYASGEVLYRLLFDPSLHATQPEASPYHTDHDYNKIRHEVEQDWGNKRPGKQEYMRYLERKGYTREAFVQKYHEYLALKYFEQNNDADDFVRSDAAAQFIRDLEDGLDKQALVKCLFPDDLKQQGSLVDSIRQRYIDWLNEHANGKDLKPQLGALNVRFHSALADYANLGAEEENNWIEFPNLWLLLLFSVVGKTALFYSDLYQQMDKLHVDDTPDPGRQWLNTIFNDDAHPIHQMLFPGEEMNASQVYNSEAELPDIPFDGSGRLRPRELAQTAALAYEKAQTEGVGPAPMADDHEAIMQHTQDSDAAHSAVGPTLVSIDQKVTTLRLDALSRFFTSLDNLFDVEKGNDAKQIKKLTYFTRLHQATQLPTFKGLHLVEKGGHIDEQKYIVLGANEVHQQRMNTKAMGPERFNAFSNAAKGGDYIEVKNARTGNIIGHTQISQKMNWYQGVTQPAAGAEFDFHSLWKKTGDRGRSLTKVTTDVDVLVVDKSNYITQMRAHLAAANLNDTNLDVHNSKYDHMIVGARSANFLLMMFMLKLEVMGLSVNGLKYEIIRRNS